MNEIMLSRAVESFDVYVLTILRVIFLAKPEMLKSEAAIEVTTILDFQTFDEIVFHLAERKLHDLSFKPLSELRKYVVSRTGIDSFKNDAVYKKVLIASEVRNLIAHNDCRINDLFKRKIGKIEDDLSVSETGKFHITDEWLRETRYALDGVAFDFDETAGEKFGLEQKNRFASLLYRC